MPPRGGVHLMREHFTLVPTYRMRRTWCMARLPCVATPGCGGAALSSGSDPVQDWVHTTCSENDHSSLVGENQGSYKAIQDIRKVTISAASCCSSIPPCAYGVDWD